MFRVDRRLTVTFDKNMNSSGKIMTSEHMVSAKQIGLIQTQVQDLSILCIGIKLLVLNRIKYEETDFLVQWLTTVDSCPIKVNQDNLIFGVSEVTFKKIIFTSEMN